LKNSLAAISVQYIYIRIYTNSHIKLKLTAIITSIYDLMLGWIDTKIHAVVILGKRFRACKLIIRDIQWYEQWR
jgi:hypothetical protein